MDIGLVCLVQEGGQVTCWEDPILFFRSDTWKNWMYLTIGWQFEFICYNSYLPFCFKKTIEFGCHFEIPSNCYCFVLFCFGKPPYLAGGVWYLFYSRLSNDYTKEGDKSLTCRSQIKKKTLDPTTYPRITRRNLKARTWNRSILHLPRASLGNWSNALYTPVWPKLPVCAKTSATPLSCLKQ